MSSLKLHAGPLTFYVYLARAKDKQLSGYALI